MKKLTVLFLLTILGVVFFTGCSVDKTASSTMVRTLGIGETAMPMEAKSFGIEFVNERITAVDVISQHTRPGFIFSETTVSGTSSLKEHGRVSGFTLRVGLDDYTEIMGGVLDGSITDGYDRQTLVDEDGDSYQSTVDLNTIVRGYRLGFKRLLTNYQSPHIVSLFALGNQLNHYSVLSRYNAKNFELKTALIYGYLPNAQRRNLPSLALFYTLANTNRKESIPSITKSKRPQAVGAEANVNLDLGPLNLNFAAGLEKEIAYASSNSGIKPYFGLKAGLILNRYQGVNNKKD